jgi:hypothetical protein
MSWDGELMDRLEERAPDCDSMAWAHRDHSSHDHVHVIAVLERRLDRDELATCANTPTMRGGANAYTRGTNGGEELIKRWPKVRRNQKYLTQGETSSSCASICISRSALSIFTISTTD